MGGILSALIVFLLILYLCCRMDRKIHSDIEHTFYEVARGRKAIIHPGEGWTLPRLSLYDVDGVLDIVTSPGGQSHPPSTEINGLIKNPTKVSMQIYRGGMVDKVGKKLNPDYILTQDPDFDEAFNVQGSDALFIQSLLTPEIRKSFLSFQNSFSVFKIQDDRAHLLINEMIESPSVFRPFIAAGWLIVKRCVELSSV